MVRDAAAGTLRPERVAREVAGILDEVTKAVDQVVASAHPSVASLHRLHRQMRRLRTGLSLWESLLPGAERELLHPLDVRVKRLSRLVGRIRDRDIALSLLQRFDGRHATHRDLLRVTRFRIRVQDDARTGRELLRAGVVFLDDLLPETAYAKLLWVLGHASDPTSVKELLLRDRAGEFHRRRPVEVPP